MQHPYLELPTALMPLVPAEVLGKLAQIRAQATQLDRLPPPEKLQKEQDELRARGGALLKARDALPWVRWGFAPASPSLLTAFTSMWIHSGWLHLLGNLLFFFATGPFLEDAWGRALFARSTWLRGSSRSARTRSTSPAARFRSWAPRARSRVSWARS